MTWETRWRCVTLAVLAATAGCYSASTSPPLSLHASWTPLAAGPAKKKAANWTNFGFDAGQSGFNNREKTLNTKNVASLTQLWQGPTIDNVFRGTLAQNGSVVYITYLASSYVSMLQALNAGNGKVLWSANTNGGLGAYTGAIAVGGGMVYTPSNSGYGVCAYAAKDGTQVWCVSPNPSSNYGPVEGGPTYANGVVYFSLEGAANVPDVLMAVDAASGTVKWQINGGSFLFDDATPPLAGRSKIYNYCTATSYNYVGICAYDTATGSTVWTYKLTTSGESFATYLMMGHNGIVYYAIFINDSAEHEQYIGAIRDSGSQGTLLWQNAYTVSGDEGTPYLTTDDKELYVDFPFAASYAPTGFYDLDAKTGKQKWHVTLATSIGTGFGDLTLANGVLYSLYDYPYAGGLLALSAANGALLFHTASGLDVSADQRPIVANGVAYAFCKAYKSVCAFGLKKQVQSMR